MYIYLSIYLSIYLERAREREEGNWKGSESEAFDDGSQRRWQRQQTTSQTPPLEKHVLKYLTLVTKISHQPQYIVDDYVLGLVRKRRRLLLTPGLLLTPPTAHVLCVCVCVCVCGCKYMYICIHGHICWSMRTRHMWEYENTYVGVWEHICISMSPYTRTHVIILA